MVNCVNPEKRPNAAEGIEDLIDAGDRDLWDISDLDQFLIVDCDPDATGFL